MNLFGGVPILTKYNHSSVSNPHPQYENWRYSFANNNIVNGVIKMFDYKLQIDPSKVNINVRGSMGFVFGAYVYTNKVGRPQTTVGIMIIIAIPNGDKVETQVKYTPLVNGITSEPIVSPIVTWEKTNNTLTNEFILNAYMLVKQPNNPFSILPFMFEQSYYINNPYDLKYSNEYTFVNMKMQLDRLFKNAGSSYTSLDQFLINNSNINIIRDQIFTEKKLSVVYNSSSGNNVTLQYSDNKYSLIILNPSAQTNFDRLFMDNVKDGDEVTIIAWNGNASIINHNQSFHGGTLTVNRFFLKGGIHATLIAGNLIKFMYINNQWVETSRNF